MGLSNFEIIQLDRGITPDRLRNPNDARCCGRQDADDDRAYCMGWCTGDVRHLRADMICADGDLFCLPCDARWREEERVRERNAFLARMQTRAANEYWYAYYLWGGDSVFPDAERDEMHVSHQLAAAELSRLERMSRGVE